MSIVENIRVFCKEANTSIPKLEKELGFGNGAIYNWDKNSPSIDKLQKVANYFKVPIDELVGWGNVFDIGWTIKEEREEQGLSLEELSHEIKIAPETLSQIEKDIIPLTSELLKAIADVFDMTVQEFLLKYEMYDEAIDEYFKGDVNAYLEFKRAEERDAMQDDLQSYLNEKNEPETIAAHHDGDEWTEEELEEIERFKEFVRMKRAKDKQE